MTPQERRDKGRAWADKDASQRASIWHHLADMLRPAAALTGGDEGAALARAVGELRRAGMAADGQVAVVSYEYIPTPEWAAEAQKASK